MSSIKITSPIEIRICPVCGQRLWADAHIAVEGDSIDAITTAVQMEVARRTELVIVAHYRLRHRWRYWLFLRTGWRRFLG